MKLDRYFKKREGKKKRRKEKHQDNKIMQIQCRFNADSMGPN